MLLSKEDRHGIQLSNALRCFDSVDVLADVQIQKPKTAAYYLI
jgi:hypothetical protein